MNRPSRFSENNRHTRKPVASSHLPISMLSELTGLM